MARAAWWLVRPDGCAAPEPRVPAVRQDAPPGAGADTVRLPQPAGRPHFAVPGAREMLLEEPQACPAFPDLTFDGLALAPDGGRHYLVATGDHLGELLYVCTSGPTPTRSLATGCCSSPHSAPTGPTWPVTRRAPASSHGSPPAGPKP